MSQTTPRRIPNQGRRRISGFVHIAEILAELDFLDGLQREALAEAECRGPISGPIRPAQRRWSRFLDLVDAERQRGAA